MNNQFRNVGVIAYEHSTVGSVCQEPLGASLQEENGISRLTVEAIVSQKLKSKFEGFKAKEIIHLHQEDLDSDKSNWNSKLKVIEKVLTEFKAFLQTLTKEKP